MSRSRVPGLYHVQSAPELLNMDTFNDSPRACDRCTKISVLRYYRLGKSSVILNICGECVRHYKQKEKIKGKPLSSRDYTPRGDS